MNLKRKEDVIGILQLLEGRKFLEGDIEEEKKTNPEGAYFSKGYNVAIEDAQALFLGFKEKLTEQLIQWKEENNFHAHP